MPEGEPIAATSPRATLAWVLGVFVIVPAFVLWQIPVEPFLWLGVLWGLALVGGGVRRRRSRIGPWLFSLGILCLGLAAADWACWRFDGYWRAPPESLCFDGAEPDLDTEHPDLGRVPRPDFAHALRMFDGDRELWSPAQALASLDRSRYELDPLDHHPNAEAADGIAAWIATHLVPDE